MTGLPRPIETYIDHTLLKPDAPEADVRRVVEEARAGGYAAACIPPCWVSLAAGILKGSGTAVCTVISFPLGYVTPHARIEESRRAMLDGATELDTVLNVSHLKSGHDEAIVRDLRAWVDACRAWGERTDRVLLKVILETALLTDEEKIRAADLVIEAGADFVKTSTGFGPGGATVEDVALLAERVGAQARIKASGGIRGWDDARRMIEAGADRLGTSSGAVIVAESRA
jgi:deoxyribose-phosphate aldolase